MDGMGHGHFAERDRRLERLSPLHFELRACRLNRRLNGHRHLVLRRLLGRRVRSRLCQERGGGRFLARVEHGLRELPPRALLGYL